MMKASFISAYENVTKLVEKFRKGEKHYLSTSYQEAEVRQDFINDFFIALGWDVLHHKQLNPYEQEVKVEKGLSVGKAQKRADYAFHIAPDYRDPKFFAEAKKPSKNLKNTDDYFQTVRYGWNANTPIAALTDFKEFHILDCRYRPDISTVLTGYHKQYHYTQYTDKEKFAQIYWLFSREAVKGNSLEKYADSLPKATGKAYQKGLFEGGYQPIDEEFLEDVDEIRERLAKAFKKNDKRLTSEELTEAVQRTIDRLVFIRFLEDKLIEQKNYISDFADKGNPWAEFMASCKKFDSKYNGIVFKKHFIDDQKFKGPELNEFQDICNELSHLNSPYDFNAIPVYILGSIYERFLGKVVHATDKQVKIEEKPEVRKAGGIYYTPKYIVDYIVKNTIGKLIENKTPEQIAQMHFADIACGSGSFLIGAFEYLLDYHSKYYQQHSDKAKRAGCHDREGKWVLSIKQKQKILLNNIYGVDLDQQAIEVTQLSLYLKMMEDETTATANEMQVLFHEKILPNLSNNIVRGNSLVATDILTQNLFTGDEELKLIPMDFDTTFPHIMKIKGRGFDAIIGNPPYVKARDYDGEKDLYRSYLNKSSQYQTLYLMWDLYVPFIERGIKLLKKNGILGLIVPDTLEKAEYSKLIKEYIVDNCYVPQIDFFPESHIFKSENKVVGVKNIILFVKTSKGNKTNKVVHNKDYTKIKSYISVPYDIDIFSTYNLEINLTKKSFKKLGDICLVSYGLRLNSEKGDKQFIFKKSDLISDEKNDRCWRKFTEGKYLSRYLINQIKYLEWNSERCPKRLVRSTFPELYDVDKLLLGRQTRAGVLDVEKIVVDNTIVISALHDSFNGIKNSHLKKYYDNLKTPRHELIKISKGYDLKYLLGIINSSVTRYFLKILTKGKLDAYPDDWKEIIIPSIEANDKGQKTLRNKVVQLVDQIIFSKQALQNVKTDKDKNYYERKCTIIDKQIDELVYHLYGLTEEEKQIVEDSCAYGAR